MIIIISDGYKRICSEITTCVIINYIPPPKKTLQELLHIPAIERKKK